MVKILGISGSLRKKSFNSALLRAAGELMPAGSTLELATIAGIPIYDGDLEDSSGLPESVAAFKERIAAADGVLIASPEYNFSLPGPMKNAIDWASRPPKDIARVFRDRPFGLIGATPGRGATRLAQSAWMDVFRALSVRPYFSRVLAIGEAGGLFDEEMALRDERTRKSLGEYIAGFVKFVESARSERA